jgi:hypothetical protein
MPARKHTHEDTVDDLAMANDDLLDLGAQCLEGSDEFSDADILAYAISL